MKRIGLILTLILAVNFTFAQTGARGKLPDSQIEVNKEYDENGNLIRYDSSAVSTWSSDTTFVVMNIDSIRNQMDLLFGDRPDFFKLDSAFFGGKDPFGNLHDDFFKQHEKLFNDFGFGHPDSNWHSFPDFSSSFPDLKQLQEEMEQNFRHFFEDDSTHIDFRGVE